MSKGRTRTTSLQLAGALLVGVVCLWLSLRGADLASFGAEIASLSLPPVILAMVCVFLVAVTKALRWQWLYGPALPSPTWSTHFAILMISQMLNLVIPVRLGELARLGLMRQEGRQIGVTFGTIVVEKSLDLLAVGLIVLLAVPLVLIPPSLETQFSTGGLLLGGAIFIMLIAIGRFQEVLIDLLARIPEPKQERWARWLGTVRRGIVAVLSSMGSLKGRRLTRVAALTAGIWLLSLLTVQIMFLAFDLSLSWGAPLALMLALTTSNWMPTPPAMIGVVGAVTVAVLSAFGVDQTRGLALGTVLNAVLVGPPVLMGGAALWNRLWQLGAAISLHSLRRAAGLSDDKPEVNAQPQDGNHERT